MPSPRVTNSSGFILPDARAEYVRAPALIGTEYASWETCTSPNTETLRFSSHTLASLSPLSPLPSPLQSLLGPSGDYANAFDGAFSSSSVQAPTGMVAALTDMIMAPAAATTVVSPPIIGARWRSNQSSGTCSAPPFPRTRNVALNPNAEASGQRDEFAFSVDLLPGLHAATGCAMHVPVTLSDASSFRLGTFRFFSDGCCWERDASAASSSNGPGTSPLSSSSSSIPASSGAPTRETGVSPPSQLLYEGEYASLAGPTRILFRVCPIHTDDSSARPSGNGNNNNTNENESENATNSEIGYCYVNARQHTNDDGNPTHSTAAIEVSRISPGPTLLLGQLEWPYALPHYASVGGLGADATDWSAILRIGSAAALQASSDNGCSASMAQSSLSSTNSSASHRQSWDFPSTGIGALSFRLEPGPAVNDTNNNDIPAELIFTDRSGRRLSTIQFSPVRNNNNNNGEAVVRANVAWFVGTRATHPRNAGSVPIGVPLTLALQYDYVNVRDSSGSVNLSWAQPSVTGVTGVAIPSSRLNGNGSSTAGDSLIVVANEETTSNGNGNGNGSRTNAVVTTLNYASATPSQFDAGLTLGSNQAAPTATPSPSMLGSEANDVRLGSIIPSSLNPFDRIEKWFREHWLIIVLVLLVIVLFLALLFRH